MKFGSLLKTLTRLAPVILASAPAVIGAVEEAKRAVNNKRTPAARPGPSPVNGGRPKGVED